MNYPFTKPIHDEILKQLAKGEKPVDIAKILGEPYCNIKFFLSEMRDLANVNTNIELGIAAGTYRWVQYP